MPDDASTGEAGMLRRIAIIGMAPSTKDLAPHAGQGFERWTLNECFAAGPAFRGCERYFEIHPREHYTNRARRSAGYLDGLRARGAEGSEVWMIDPDESIPNVRAYPAEAVLALFGEYITSSVAWMIALAIFELTEGGAHVSNGAFPLGELYLWGCDHSSKPEYIAQRACVEYLLGWARGVGIRVVLPDACPLLRDPVYGRPSLEDQHRRGVLEALQAEAKALKQEVSNLNLVQAKLSGRVEEHERIWAMTAGGRTVAQQVYPELRDPAPPE